MKTNDNFTVHGTYVVSNAGGFEIELSSDGEAARMRDAFGSDTPEISDWKCIEYVPDFTGELIPTIDPDGYNIPLGLVMRVR